MRYIFGRRRAGRQRLASKGTDLASHRTVVEGNQTGYACKHPRCLGTHAWNSIEVNSSASPEGCAPRGLCVTVARSRFVGSQAMLRTENRGTVTAVALRAYGGWSWSACVPAHASGLWCALLLLGPLSGGIETAGRACERLRAAFCEMTRGRRARLRNEKNRTHGVAGRAADTPRGHAPRTRPDSRHVSPGCAW